MSTTLARRLGRLEAVQRAEQERRWQAAVGQLRATMDPDHARLVADWLRANIAGKRLGPCTGDPQTHVCPRCIDRLHPPALARAVWFMLIENVTSGTPVALPPNVAEVYVNDPDAYPANACESCGYLLPTRGRLRSDGTYEHRAWYLGPCPVCGLDNHPQAEDEEAGDDVVHDPAADPAGRAPATADA